MRKSLFCWCLAFVGCAQTPKARWAKLVGTDDAALISVNDAAVDADANVIVAGNYAGAFDMGGGPLMAPSDAFAAFLAKYASTGALLWSQSIGGVGDRRIDKVTVDGSGDISVLGRADAASQASVIVRYAKDGSRQWQANFPGLALAATSDGGVVSLGQFKGSDDLGSGPLAPGVDFVAMLRAHTAAGVVAWSKLLSPSVHPDTLIVSPSSGAIIVAGTFSGGVDFGTGALDSGAGALFVAAYDASGTATTVAQLDAGDGYDWITLAATADGGVVVLASFGRTRLTLSKVMDGTMQWTRSAFSALPGNALRGGGAFCVAPNGQVYLATSELPANAGQLDIPFAAHLHLMRFSAAGAPVWTHSFFSNGFEWVSGLVAMPTSELLLVGATLHGDRMDFGSGLLKKTAADYRLYMAALPP